jgi:hypothetical protein
MRNARKKKGGKEGGREGRREGGKEGRRGRTIETLRLLQIRVTPLDGDKATGRVLGAAHKGFHGLAILEQAEEGGRKGGREGGM